MNFKQRLDQEIEKEREEMLKVAREYPLTSAEVLKASQKLDQLINRYTELKIS